MVRDSILQISVLVSINLTPFFFFTSCDEKLRLWSTCGRCNMDTALYASYYQGIKTIHCNVLQVILSDFIFGVFNSISSTLQYPILLFFNVLNSHFPWQLSH